ncbi:distal tail protein Dit [Lacticaseibacillus absianus]|uniref:distal tail protein Dit n=1 Tax=Lacticaseibacillus absianus TaxID=2729623 RepID=UPI0015CB0FA6|nr:distal tail protein Dit [Lacticaseibacillus absianus]
MTFKWIFNGEEMSKYIRTTDVERDIGQNRTADLHAVGVNDGRSFRRTVADAGTIVVTGLVIRDLPEKRRDIARILMTSKPVKLTFSDEPDVYYMAIAEGQTSLSEVFNHGSIQITCRVPDAVALAEDPLSQTSGASGELISITNAGTAPTAPILTATMAGDNGLVAWTNDKGGVLQFGSPDELDGETKEKSVHALATGYSGAPSGVAYNTAATNYPNYLGDASRPNKQQGRIDYKEDYTGGQSAVPYFANGNTGDWGGPSIYLPISGGSSGNFSCRTRFYFGSSVTRQGRLEITLQNGTEAAYQFVIRDSSASEEQYRCELWALDKALAEFTLTSAQIGTAGYRQVTISKIKDELRFEIGHVSQKSTGQLDRSVVKSYTLSEIADLPVDGYSVWFERYRDKEHVLMALNDTRFDWLNVNYWKDDPNRFMADDVVTADVATKTVYVNGVEDATLQRVGNMWDSFILPAGDTIIQPVASEWAEPFKAQIEYREAWY